MPVVLVLQLVHENPGSLFGNYILIYMKMNLSIVSHHTRASYWLFLIGPLGDSCANGAVRSSLEARFLVFGVAVGGRGVDDLYLYLRDTKYRAAMLTTSMTANK